MRYWATRLPFAVATFLVGLAVAGLFSPFTGGLFGAGAYVSDGPGVREVLRAEAEYVRAYNERNAAALAPLLADDMRAVRWGQTKAERLDNLSDPRLQSLRLETENVSVRVAGDKAWVKGHARLGGRHAGRSFGTWEYEYARSYEKRGGRWQVVSMRFSRPR
ncbi:MAG TPA: nuclear transport factor 2 family protein [Pyrinomonadaceae bacterium]|nr:nuclear transport factor 2 family protein [Pyrinomonadaceae bacterium]